MFEPITAKQNAYLARLIVKTGKEKYLDVKRELGLHGLTILQLTKAQAARLIKALKNEAGQ